MARSTKLEAQETRSRILDAAEAVFHAEGVSNTSLDAVAHKAGVTRGAIYWHFKNKSDLFDAMTARVRLPMEALLEASGDPGEPDPLGQLRAALIFVLQETALNPQSRTVFDIIFLKCEFVQKNDPICVRRQKEFSKANANFHRVMVNAISKGQLPENLKVDLACNALHAMVVGLINNWLFMPGVFDLAQGAGALVDGCLDMLRYGGSFRNQ